MGRGKGIAFVPHAWISSICVFPGNILIFFFKITFRRTQEIMHMELFAAF